jgi:phage-related holin
MIIPAWIGPLVLKWIAAAPFALILTIPYAIQVLAALLCAEMVTAIFSPKRSLRASLKVAGLTLFLCIGLAVLETSARVKVGFNLGFDAASMMACFYCVNAGISILTNLSDAGCPLPPALLTAMKKIQGITPQQEREIDALSLKQTQEEDALQRKQAQEADALQKKHDV